MSVFLSVLIIKIGLMIDAFVSINLFCLGTVADNVHLILKLISKRQHAYAIIPIKFIFINQTLVDFAHLVNFLILPKLIASVQQIH